jgi:hypothetical protein
MCLNRLRGPPSVLSNGYRGQFQPGVKWPEREAEQLAPPNAEVKNVGAIAPLPHVFMSQRLIN